MRKLLLISGALILCAVSITTTLKFVSAQQGTGESLTKLTKTAAVGTNWVNSIDLNLTGMTASDAVNINLGTASVISAKVITVAERSVTFPGGNNSVTVPLPGADVPDESLNVSPNTISFTRPAINGRILLYIEVPASAKLTISQDESLVVDEYLVSSPLKLKDGNLVKGQPSLSKSVLSLMNPQAEVDVDEIKQVGNGVYFVPFEKLEILNGQNSLAGLSFTANVEFDETGAVQNVKVMNPLNSSTVQNAIMGLQFKPFKLNGSNVKVSTVMKQ